MGQSGRHTGPGQRWASERGKWLWGHQLESQYRSQGCPVCREGCWRVRWRPEHTSGRGQTGGSWALKVAPASSLPPGGHSTAGCLCSGHHGPRGWHYCSPVRQRRSPWPTKTQKDMHVFLGCGAFQGGPLVLPRPVQQGVNPTSPKQDMPFGPSASSSRNLF